MPFYLVTVKLMRTSLIVRAPPRYNRKLWTGVKTGSGGVSFRVANT